MTAIKPADSVTPEFAKIPQAVKMFGLSRSVIYALISDGAIRSVSVRRRGALRGSRLVDCDSVRELLKKSAA